MKNILLNFIQKNWFKYLAKISNLKIYGQENIPKNTNFIVAANHDGYFDLDFIMYAFNEYEIHFVYEIPRIMKFLPKLWYRGKGLGVLYEGENKKEVNHRALANVLRYLEMNENVGIMPQGPIGYMYEKSEERRFYPGCAIISCRSGKPIIPVRILNDETYIYNFKRYVNPFFVVYSTLLKLKKNVKRGKPVILLIGQLIYPNLKKFEISHREYITELTYIIKNNIFELEEKFNKGEFYV